VNDDTDILVIPSLDRFPCVRDRFGHMQDLDLDILSVVSFSLYSNLSSDDDRDLFISTLACMGGTEASTTPPLHRVIAFIRQRHQDAQSANCG
jgi:hypothetical protein